MERSPQAEQVFLSGAFVPAIPSEDPNFTLEIWGF
jgi:hypothetical protein